MMAGMRIRIDAVDLPGRTRPAPAGSDGPAYAGIHVAVQRRDRPAELLAPQPGDAASATWTLECTATATPAGIDVTGPYVQDRLGGRFVYLSWCTADDSGVFSMFRAPSSCSTPSPQTYSPPPRTTDCWSAVSA